MAPPAASRTARGASSAEREIQDALHTYPEGFTPNRKLARQLEQRAKVLDTEGGTLNERQRDVIILRFLQGLDVSEVAFILNISIGAVKTLQHRALQNLRQLLGNES